jgi:hypothetical protein
MEIARHNHDCGFSIPVIGIYAMDILRPVPPEVQIFHSAVVEVQPWLLHHWTTAPLNFHCHGSLQNATGSKMKQGKAWQNTSPAEPRTKSRRPKATPDMWGPMLRMTTCGMC